MRGNWQEALRKGGGLQKRQMAPGVIREFSVGGDPANARKRKVYVRMGSVLSNVRCLAGRRKLEHLKGGNWPSKEMTLSY